MTTELQVIYEDNHLIVVHKPAGLLTQPTNLEAHSLELQVKKWIKEKYQKPGEVFLHAVHRLDRPVEGLVLFAKTSKALSRLNESMRNKECEKIYHAKYEGKLPASEGLLENKLVHGEHEAYEDPNGKLSRLRYRVIAPGEAEIHLETGRYHQIRLQFALAGCPLLGDAKYGSKLSHGGHIALVHSKLTITHPVTKERLTFTL